MCACEIQQKNQEREGQQLLVSRSAQEALSGAGFCFFQPLVSNRLNFSSPVATEDFSKLAGKPLLALCSYLHYSLICRLTQT